MLICEERHRSIPACLLDIFFPSREWPFLFFGGVLEMFGVVRRSSVGRRGVGNGVYGGRF